jgi:hypothetical protein
MVKFSLSSSEMNGDNITVVCIDAAGAEWCDQVINIQTSARQIDDLAYPATSGRSMVVDASGLVDANTVKIGPTGSGTAQTARDVGASVLLSTGTGTGQLDFTSGVVKANLAQILGTALTETAGLLAGGFKKFFNIATPASTMDALTLVATATNLTNAPTSGDLTATMKTSVTTAASAATPVATVSGDLSATMKTSVTTACTASTPTVAAVTGNVGGNVVGTVASVVGSVGSVTGLTASNLDATISSRLATSGYTAPDNGTIAAIAGYVDTEVAAIKAKTDQLTFTKANELDVNTVSVNEVTVNGVGTAGSPWGP